VLWHPANQAMFCGHEYAPTEDARRHFAEAAARTFLAAHRRAAPTGD
jgi:hypothetical protein